MWGSDPFLLTGSGNCGSLTGSDNYPVPKESEVETTLPKVELVLHVVNLGILVEFVPMED